MDARSKRNVSTLHPKVQELAMKWYDLCHERNLPVVIIDGSRTWEDQEAIYEQGRGKPGKIVTNARPGQSLHNYGIAWDFGVFDGVSVDGGIGHYHDESPIYDKAGEAAEELGLEWGGRWEHIIDRPHIQYKTGLTLAELRAKHDNGEAIV